MKPVIAAVCASIALCVALPAQAYTGTLKCAKTRGYSDGKPIDTSTLKVVTSPGKAVFWLNGNDAPFNHMVGSRDNDSVVYRDSIVYKDEIIQGVVSYNSSRGVGWVTYKSQKSNGSSFFLAGFNCSYVD